MDLDTLKEHIDLLALVAPFTTLKRVAASGGGEWAGPCPFCGGRDRFRVQPHAPQGGRWLCRYCTGGKWQDVIAFGQRLWPAVPFLQVCERLVGGSVEAYLDEAHRGKRISPPTPAYTPPQGDWQSDARLAIEICEQNLSAADGEAALNYLAGRGLQPDTISYWRLGYSPGARFGQLWVPRGVVIPCIVQKEVWYLKILLLPDDPVRCQDCRQQTPARRPCPQCGAVNKYRGVRGNRPAAIFGADELLAGAWGALFVEGEMDMLVAWQELQDVIAVCTLGSAANRPDLATWGPYLLPLQVILAAYDADEAGERGLQALQALAEKVRVVPLPPGVKDLNDYVLQGGELWPWLKEALLRLELVSEE
ncbi:MAG: primase-helicase zinc-binding domain-containing protein [Anaerolineales bacterium]|jgi:hypothetical protein